MQIYIFDSYEDLSTAAAAATADTLNLKPDSVLGLATGSTPLGLYRELIRMHREEGLDFSRVTTFNLDEYVGLPKTHPQSYHFFMNRNFFRHINILPQNTYVPAGTTNNHKAFCDWYENRIKESGGIDIQILGIGTDGHIAFNEPTSSLGSRTRIKTLSKQTRDDNSRFFEKPGDVPVYAITMGVGTILEARRIFLIATGAAKAVAVAGAIEGPVSSMNTGSALQLHQDVVVFLDNEAAGKLKLIDYYHWIQENEPDAPEVLRKQP